MSVREVSAHYFSLFTVRDLPFIGGDFHDLASCFFLGFFLAKFLGTHTGP